MGGGLDERRIFRCVGFTSSIHMFAANPCHLFVKSVAYRALNGEGVVASGSSSTAGTLRCVAPLVTFIDPNHGCMCMVAPPTPDHPMEVVPSVPVAFTPLPLSVSTPVLGNTSVPVPQTSTHRPLLPPPAPRNEANAWLLSARALWKDGQARLAGDQVVKGVLILDALIESPSAIISTVSAERGTTSPCSILGPAERNGVAPSDLLAIVDLIACGSHGNISNSFTNLEEHPHEVTAADVLALQVGFLRGEYVPASQRLLSAFDIPATASGHLRCEYGSKPFVPGVDSRISQPTITWTFPGAITYPHMDGIFGLHVIHLMGTKMWIFAPPTKRNFQIMSN